jgi:hypothetical protein
LDEIHIDIGDASLDMSEEVVDNDVRVDDGDVMVGDSGLRVGDGGVDDNTDVVFRASSTNRLLGWDNVSDDTDDNVLIDDSEFPLLISGIIIRFD